MSKNLVIVESPAKAKTIEKYLGKDYTVKSSFGHVRDLPKGNDSIDIAHGFKPRYEISEDKRSLVNELKALARTSDMVWLATDDDREGEAISWHLKEALDLKDSDLKRIVFHEITETAIKKAIANPRGIDYHLVNAQQARRVLDRLVGFELSPLLWKKIKTGLSAGRVQSVAVRIIVEREREIEKFNSKSAFKVSAKFAPKGHPFTAELPERFNAETDAEGFLNACIPAVYSVTNLETKPGKRTPAAPFTTSTLQQEASLKLGYSVAQTMLLAQKLYEAGHISYMRTDSLNLSQQALQAAKEEIIKDFGERYSKTRVYKTKSENAQEAHEAIRPTNFAALKAGADRDEQRLYDLIWKRTVASQMADAELERTVATIGISTVPQVLVATGEVIKFDGFLKVYIESSGDGEPEEENTSLLPPLSVGQVLDLQQMTATERYSRPPARYTEAGLVKKLEEMGIGRPSTYAPTISTIIRREYVLKESREGKERKFRLLTLAAGKVTGLTKQEVYGAEKAKLFPTDMVVDYSFTAEAEKEFDQIAAGGKEWSGMIDNFYKGFHADVETTSTIDRSSVPTGRDLGIHPENGKRVSVRLGRFGPMAQIGEQDDPDKPLFAGLKKNPRMETITLEEALDLFRLPRESGVFEDKPMTVGTGRFGPYVRHDAKFYSLAKTDDPYTVTAERCVELIEGKRKAEAEKVIKVFAENPEVRVLRGQWGPYIAGEGKNAKIPKGVEPDQLGLDECLKLLSEAPEARKRFGAKVAPAAKEKVSAAPKAKAPAKTAKPKAAAKPASEAKPKVSRAKAGK